MCGDADETGMPPPIEARYVCNTYYYYTNRGDSPTRLQSLYGRNSFELVLHLAQSSHHLDRVRLAGSLLDIGILGGRNSQPLQLGKQLRPPLGHGE